MNRISLILISLSIATASNSSHLQSQSIDAAIQLNNRTYLFKDSLYYRFSWSDTGSQNSVGPVLDKSYPRPLPGGWLGLKGHFLSKIDAALHYKPSGKNYFFSGDEYVRLSGTEVDPGYPKKTSRWLERTSRRISSRYRRCNFLE